MTEEENKAGFDNQYCIESGCGSRIGKEMKLTAATDITEVKQLLVIEIPYDERIARQTVYTVCYHSATILHFQ